MEFIKYMINEHRGDLTESLSSAGFSADQAKNFLPEIASSISSACDKDGIESIVSGMTSGNYSQLLESINIGDIASKLGIHSELVSSGFESIIPALNNLFSTNGTGLPDTISAATIQSDGDLLDIVNTLY